MTLNRQTGLRLDSDAPVSIARELMLEYAEQLGFDLCFQNFEAEVAALPGAYASPAGCILVAFLGEEPAGCGALRPLPEHRCEIKRLYIRQKFRHLGLGRALAEALVGEARLRSYRAIRLDTLASMLPAINLYLSLGFRAIPPYCLNPIPASRFFELTLNEETT